MTVNRSSASAALLGLLVAGLASVSACSNGTGQANITAPTPPPSTSAAAPTATTAPAPAPRTATGAPPATTPPAPVTKQYDAARAQWQSGATAISAEQGKFWSQAAADLILGETTDTDPTGYANAVTMLKQLVTLPDAQQTTQQNAEFHADIDGLNTFFKTPGLYS
jgi:hypothetical protein